MATRRSIPESIPPTLSPHQAIPLLERQLERLEIVIALPHNDPDVDGWESTTTDILNQAFGQPNGEMHQKTHDFVRASSGLPIRVSRYGHRPDPRIPQMHHVKQQEKRRGLLKAYIEQLRDLAPPSTASATTYPLHSEIERVSGKLFQDRHYKQAALDAYIRVINEVKSVSGIAEDGDSLMNRAFGCERQTPVIQFNDLTSDAERDEQRGIMHLFKGLVGLRNMKAHTNSPVDDPVRARELLGLASLLMRLLGLARVNRTTV